VRKLFLPVCACLIASTLFSGCALMPAEEEPLPVPVSNNPDVTYVTTPVMRGDLEDTVEFSARLNAQQTVDVSFVTDGRIEQIHAKKGDMVEAGDILMELENEDAQFQLDIADIRMEIQQMQHDYVTDRNRESSVAYQIAELQMDLQQLDYDRLKNQVEQSYLYAPISGVISYRIEDVTAGDFIEKNVRVYTVADTTALVAESGFNDTKGIRKGMDVELYLASADLRMVGTVAHLPSEKKPDSDDTYGKIIIEIPEDMQDTVANYYGQTMQAIIRRDSLKNVLYVPENLVKTSGGKTFLRVLEGEIIVEKEVVLGESVKGYVEIKSGVEEGEEVILK